MPDNGIKFLARGGVKLDDAIEHAIEQRLREPWDRPTGAGVGRMRTVRRRGRPTTPRTSPTRCPGGLDGLKVVLDCAHGAASDAGPRAAARRRCRGRRDLRRARRAQHQRRLRLHAPRRAPAGRRRARRRRRLRPRRGRRPLPGRRPRRQRRRRRPDPGRSWRSRCATPARSHADTVVATVMSNLGFVQAMRREGIGVRQTKVGDRYVLEAMKAGRLHPRRRAVRARDPERPRHHRRRHPHRPARAGPDGGDEHVAGRRWPA